MPMSDGTPTRRELWIDAREDPKVYEELAREHGLPVALGPDAATVAAEVRGWRKAIDRLRDGESYAAWCEAADNHTWLTAAERALAISAVDAAADYLAAEVSS